MTLIDDESSVGRKQRLLTVVLIVFESLPGIHEQKVMVSDDETGAFSLSPAGEEEALCVVRALGSGTELIVTCDVASRHLLRKGSKLIQNAFLRGTDPLGKFSFLTVRQALKEGLGDGVVVVSSEAQVV